MQPRYKEGHFMFNYRGEEPVLQILCALHTDLEELKRDVDHHIKAYKDSGQAVAEPQQHGP